MTDWLRNIISGGNARTALLKKNILFSFLLKGWSGAVIFLLAPITLLCLGKYSNGVWMTISSMLIWIDSCDIGLGNGLRNKLATYMAQDDEDKARKAVSTTFFMLAMIIVPITAFIIIAISCMDIYGVLNIEEGKVPDLLTALTVAIIMVGSTFIFKFIGNFYMGLQLPAVNNALVCGGQTLVLLGTYVCYYAGWHSLTAIALANTLAPLIVWIVSYPLTFSRLYPRLSPSIRCFRWDMVKELIGLGGQFFIMQMASMVLFMSSNVLITRWFTAELVTPYNLAYRYFSILLIITTVACTPFWTATTDAYTRGDIAWIKDADRKMRRFSMIIVAMAVVMAALSGLAYYLWINLWMHDKVEIPFMLTAGMGVYILILIMSMRYSFFLNGVGALRLQLYTTLFAAVIFIPLAWFAVGIWHDVSTLLGVMCLVNLPGLIINRIQFRKILSGKAQGIWKL